MKYEVSLWRQTIKRMDLLQMLRMCAMWSSLANEASRSVFATPEEGVLGQCSIAPPMKYTLWRIMAWQSRIRMRPVVYSRTRWFQHKTAVAQSIGLPSRFIFSIRAFICSFFLSAISIMKKLWADGWSARYLLLCLKTYLAFSSQLENKVALLVEVW